jgi:tRNA-guanine family transglycosylase
MPVATQASLKGLTAEQLEETGCRLCLNNTYHLGLKPGQAVLDAIGGAHKLQGWNYNILTDSGGLVTALQMLLMLVGAYMSSGSKWSPCLNWQK